ncbi:MAG: PilZ domain-containing protein [Rhizobiaceae bacterium]
MKKTDCSGIPEQAESGSINTVQDNSENRSDRRAAPRVEAHELSEITMDTREIPVTCLIRNISKTGALIESASQDINDRFILTNHARKNRVICRVAWRKGNLMGVHFLTAPRDIK